jgi:hypothetical protein
MNNFLKEIIEETFTSKKQQRLFYAKANDKSLPKKERNKWSKWAKEFSDETDFKKIPDEVKKEKEVDEIVDVNGNISRSKKPANFNTKGITDDDTLDDAVKKGHGMMGTYGSTGVQNYRRYWGESDMSKSLGYEDTLGKDEDYEEAKDHFEDDLGLDPEEAKERMNQMGYDKKLPGDKVRLVENPKKFMEEYIESILNKKTKIDDLVPKKENETEDKKINPIVLKQISALKNSMDSHKLSINDIMKHLK